MIAESDIDEAFALVRKMAEEGPPVEEYLSTVGFDPEDVHKCADDHAQMAAYAGLIPNHPRAIKSTAITFGAGFVLAVVIMEMERNRR